MNRTTFHVGCELSYQVSGPSAFIFNIGVVNNSFQRVLEEQFATTPIYQVEESLPSVEEKGTTVFPLRRGRCGCPIKRRLN